MAIMPGSPASLVRLDSVRLSNTSGSGFVPRMYSIRASAGYGPPMPRRILIGYRRSQVQPEDHSTFPIPRSRAVVSKRVSYLSIQRCLVTGGQVLNHLSKTWVVNVWGGGGTGELSSQVRKQSPVIFGWVVDGVHEGVRHSARPTGRMSTLT